MSDTKTVKVRNIDNQYKDVTIDKLRWRPSAYAVIIKDGAVLAVPDKKNRYDLPGGGLDFGEMPEESVIREVREETGLIAADPKLITVKCTFFEMPDVAEDYIQSLMLYYTARVAGGELSTEFFEDGEEEELNQAEWVPLDKLDEIAITSSVDWRVIARQCASGN